MVSYIFDSFRDLTPSRNPLSLMTSDQTGRNSQMNEPNKGYVSTTDRVQAFTARPQETDVSRNIEFYCRILWEKANFQSITLQIKSSPRLARRLHFIPILIEKWSKKIEARIKQQEDQDSREWNRKKGRRRKILKLFWPSKSLKLSLISEMQTFSKDIYQQPLKKTIAKTFTRISTK